MEIKPGKQTSEFWVTVITNIINAVLMILLAVGFNKWITVTTS